MSGSGDGPDLAARELVRQMRALPAARYEFAVLDSRMVRRVWRLRQALKSMPWLRQRNAGGAHVLFRPATTACVLVEGLCAERLAAAADDGLRPAVVVETGPDDRQAWFRLGRELGPRLATCAGRILAARCGGDPAAADFRRLGRAAGFVNRALEHREGDGGYPLVRVVEAKGRVAPGAEELVAEAEEWLRAGKERRARARAGPAGRASSRGRDPEAFLAREVGRIVCRHGAAADMGRAEAAAARRMALAGFGRDEVADALAALPAVRRRKAGCAADYAERTAAWAVGAKRRRPR